MVASRASASGSADLAELSRDLEALEAHVARLCDYAGPRLSGPVDELARCVESGDPACAASALSRLRASLRSLAPSAQALAGLLVLRVVSGLGLLVLALYLTISPASAPELWAASIGSGLAVAALLLYRSRWSGAVTAAGSALMAPVALLSGQALAAAALLTLLACGVGAALADLELRRLVAASLAGQPGT